MVLIEENSFQVKAAGVQKKQKKKQLRRKKESNPNVKLGGIFVAFLVRPTFCLRVSFRCRSVSSAEHREMFWFYF